MTLFDLLEPDGGASVTTPSDSLESAAVDPPPGDSQDDVDLSANAGPDTADMVVAMEASPTPEAPGNGGESGDYDRTRAEGRQESGSLVRLFVAVEDLFAPNDLGDLLRLANVKLYDIRLVPKEGGGWELLLRNPVSGMWRLQSSPDFPGLLDLALTEANAEAVRIAEEAGILGDRALARLRRHVDGGVSPTRVLKRAARLADDPSVPIVKVDPGSLNPLSRYPILLCLDDLVQLSDGAVVDPPDLTPHLLLDMMPCPTAFVRDAADSEAPGAAMMRRFMRYLGNGDERMLPQRLGWHLSGHHHTIDVIAGDYDALVMLAQALHDTLGPSGARVVSMGQGAVRPRDMADAMELARLCLWTGADVAKRIPVWELHSLVTDIDPRRQGNIVLLVADWPVAWDTLEHRIANACGWAWRVDGSQSVQGIDPDVLLDQDGRECLLAMLVEGAGDAWRQFQATREANGGDPSQVAASNYTRTCAEELRIAGATPQQRVLYRALRFTDDPDDVMTMADIEHAITAVGEEPIAHHVVGRVIPGMWPRVETGRSRIDGQQHRVVRRIASRVHGDLPHSDD